MIVIMRFRMVVIRLRMMVMIRLEPVVIALLVWLLFHTRAFPFLHTLTLATSSDWTLGDLLAPADVGVQAGSEFTGHPAVHWPRSDLAPAVLLIQEVARVTGGDITGSER